MTCLAYAPFIPSLALLAALLAAALPASAAARPRVLSAQQWREDLQTLAEQLPRTHRNAFHSISRDSFTRQVAELDRRIPSLSDAEVIVELARMVASVGDGHTRLTLPQHPAMSHDRGHTPTPPPAESALQFHHLPLRLYLYQNGLHVRAAAGPYGHLAGARVDSVGGMSADQALEAVRPLVSRDNEIGLRLVAPAMLEIPEVLVAQGITRDPSRSRFVLRDRKGRSAALELAPLGGPSGAWIEARDSSVAAPLWQRDPHRPFWFEVLPERRAVYAQVNAVTNGHDESLAKFSRRLMEAASAPGIDRLVLDLRLNGGGDNTLARSLVLGTCRTPSVNRPGHLFVIVGRATFSAAMNLASYFEYWTNALFVGEPTGASPSGYGDARKFRLPNSGLTVRASTIYWRDWSPSEDRPWIAPDLPVELSSEDERWGRDPALEAALAWTPHESISGTVGELLRRGDTNGAALSYFRYRCDPATATVPVEGPMTDLGRELLAAERVEPAVVVFSLLAQDHPHSAAAAEGLGDAYATAGKRDEAEQQYRRALELAPENREIRTKLEGLGGGGAGER